MNVSLWNASLPINALAYDPKKIKIDAPGAVASQAGVFRVARFSFPPPPPTPHEKRAPLKTPAWEATGAWATARFASLADFAFLPAPLPRYGAWSQVSKCQYLVLYGENLTD